jgi:hypothetical protein
MLVDSSPIYPNRESVWRPRRWTSLASAGTNN